MVWLSDKIIYNIEAIKRQKAHKRKLASKAARKARKNGREVPYAKGMGKEFYLTREWRELRWKVLIASDGKCKMCGRGKQDGVIIHVDHIKPRSKFQELELVFNNLQVLCEDCNLGKSNT